MPISRAARGRYVFPTAKIARGPYGIPTEMEPYGSIIDKPGIGPEADFCMVGDQARMQDVYWNTLAGNIPDSQLGVGKPEVYLRKLPKWKCSC